VSVFFFKNVGPELRALSFDKVSSLHSIEVVSVSHFHKLHVAGSPCSLVGDESKIWVSLITVLSNNFAVIVLIVNEESLGVFVDIDVDDGQSIVKSWLLNSFLVSCLEPSLEKLKLASLFELFNEFWNGADSD
jgi:hypothetical protein